MSTQRISALFAFVAVVAAALLWIWLAGEQAGRTSARLSGDGDGSERNSVAPNAEDHAREELVTRAAPPPTSSTATRAVFGKVVDPSGAPVSAEVEAAFLRRRETSLSEAVENASITEQRSAQAGADGTYRIELGSALAHHVLLSIAKPGLAHFRACFACSPTESTESTDLGTIALQRGGRVYGRTVGSGSVGAGGGDHEVGSFRVQPAGPVQIILLKLP